MIARPADCFRHITGHFFYRNLRNKSVVGRDKHEAFIHERLRLRLDSALVPLPPSAAVNPHDDRMLASSAGSIHIEHLAFGFRFGVSNVTLNSRLGGEKGRSEKQNGDDDG